LFPLVGFANQNTFIVTAYCPCRECVGLYSGGPTASGVMPKAGVTIAAPRWIPFGTILDIRGIGRRIVQDRLALRYDNRIDIFMRSHREAKRFGIKKLSVTNVKNRPAKNASSAETQASSTGSPSRAEVAATPPRTPLSGG
jgi:3D (Asp-Asp-Asp) domain-containing protein